MDPITIQQNGMLFLTVLFLLIVGVLIIVVMQLRRTLASNLSTQNLQLEKEVQALNSTVMILGKRILQLEGSYSQVNHRQEMLEGERNGYMHGEAVEYARQGGSAEGIMRKFRLSSTEADLIMMMHGTK